MKVKLFSYLLALGFIVATFVWFRPQTAQFEPPQVEELTLASGIEVFLLEDHELPTFELKAIFSGGTLYDSKGQSGLADLTASLLRKGGTKDRSPEEVDAFLEDRSAAISFGANLEMLTASASCLKEDIEEVLTLFFEILQNPRFDENRFAITKEQWKDFLQRENDEPFTIASREFQKIVYGTENPWGVSPSFASLDHISSGDLKKQHATFYRPHGMKIAVSGDFRQADLVKLLSHLSQDWQVPESSLDLIPPLEKTFTEGFYFAAKPLSQATVTVGHFGDKRNNPEKFALMVLDEMLGGSKGPNHLKKVVRSEKGLAYTIESSFSFRRDYGLFQVTTQTEAKNTLAVLALIRQEIEKIQNTRPEDLRQEVEDTKTAILRSLIFAMESRFDIVSQEVEWDYFGYPKNYFEVFRKGIEAVSADDVVRVAREYLQPQKMQVFVVGPESLAADLKGLGSVQRVSLEP